MAKRRAKKPSGESTLHTERPSQSKLTRAPTVSQKRHPLGEVVHDERREPQIELPGKLTARDYKIAMMAWKDALSVTTILDELGEAHDAKGITSIRRSLQKAMRLGVLEFHPPKQRQLEENLRKCYPTLDSVYVEIDQSATLLRAAELILEEVERFLKGTADRFTCANAGGITISELFAVVDRLVPIRRKTVGKRVLSVSLNSAEDESAFSHSSNYLCVKFSEIMTAEHMAVVRGPDEPAPESYRQIVQAADLVVSAAGGAEGFLARWLKQRGRALPEGSVGDVAFHPLNAYGVPLSLDMKSELELQRSPDWHTLVQLFNNKKLLLVLTGDKFEISLALFRAGLPRRCVMDSNIADFLCRNAPPST